MSIWLLFLLVTICLAFFVDFYKSIPSKRLIFFSLTFFSVFYYSGFRDHLGADYVNYLGVLGNLQNSITFTEPGYYLIVKFSNYIESNLSFFLFFSFVTNYFFLKFFKKYSRSFFLAMVIYLLVPTLFFNSFNLVRQIFAGALFLYSLQYIQNKNFIKFLLFIIVASLVHKSALFLLPLYYILNIKFSRLFYVFVILFSFTFGSIIKPDIASLLNGSLIFYSFYLSEAQNIGYSIGSLSIILNFIALLVVFCWKRLNLCESDILIYKVYLIGVFLFNFIPTLYFLFRLSYYFLNVLPVIISFFYIGRRSVKVFLSTFVLLFFSLYFTLFLLRFENDHTVIPVAILSLYDL